MQPKNQVFPSGNPIIKFSQPCGPKNVILISCRQKRFLTNFQVTLDQLPVWGKFLLWIKITLILLLSFATCFIVLIIFFIKREVRPYKTNYIWEKSNTGFVPFWPKFFPREIVNHYSRTSIEYILQI